jgi:hypothetical protein
LNADFSVAPEIAQLAGPAAAGQALAAPRTDGRIAADLACLAAAAERWWDLVRFDPDRAARVPVAGAAGTWLLVLPPGAVTECDCRQATALAGEAVELAGSGLAGTESAGTELAGTESAGTELAGTESAGTAVSRPLRPGRVRVHGTAAPHRLRAVGPGYSVTLHSIG